MTNKEFKKSVAAIAKAAMQRNQLRYVDIEINYGLPYVSIGMNGCDFFAQGEDARELIEQAVETGNKTQLSIATCLIWHLDGAGALS